MQKQPDKSEKAEKPEKTDKLEKLSALKSMLRQFHYPVEITSLHELVMPVDIQNIHAVLKHLRDNESLKFKQLIDITAVDRPQNPKRFEIVYLLLSTALNARLRLSLSIDEDVIVPSVTDLFSSANWAEREIWDMFGLYFSGHPDLRRLLTDYGFEGHPLRKDFPLSGYVEVRYNDTQRRVVYEPVHLTQEYRDFDFLSPWEGASIIKDSQDQEQIEEQIGEEAEHG